MPYFDLDPLLETMLDYSPGISDLNLSVGRPPQVELDGQLRPVAYAGIERLLPYQTDSVIVFSCTTLRAEYMILEDTARSPPYIMQLMNLVTSPLLKRGSATTSLRGTVPRRGIP